MPSAYIRRRATKDGTPRFHVRYRLGGREAPEQHAGVFDTRREAEARRRWLDGEIAAMRAPDLSALTREPERAPTVAAAAAAWLASRVDVAPATALYFRTSLGRILPTLGDHRIDELAPADVAAWVAHLHGEGKKPSTIRKSANVLAQVLDHAGVDPNPARDRRVKLPRNERGEVEPPTAAHVAAVLGACARKYRLPLVVLDATGMRVGELESLTWGDVDEEHGRWRVTRDRSKTRRPRWVQVPPEVFGAVMALRPREDRDLTAEVFPGLAQERLRTDITRACRATGTPAWSPHDLRHRRISLWHREGVPWAEIGHRVGQSNLSTTADTYTHVIAGEELRHAEWV